MEVKEEQFEIDLIQFIREVWRFKIIMVLVFALILGGFIFKAFTDIPKYESSSLLVYQSATNNNSSMMALASLAGVNLGGNPNNASNYLEQILKSSDLSQILLEKEWKVSKLFADTSRTYNLEEIWNIQVDTTEEDWLLKKQENLLDRLRSNDYIKYNKDKVTGVIILTTEFEDPLLAMNINQFLFEELNRILVNNMSFKAADNRKFIEERLIELKQDLEKSENQLLRFRENNKFRDTPQSKLEEARLQRNLTINQELVIQMQKQFEMAKIEETKDLPVLDLIDSARIPIYKSKPRRKILLALGILLGGFGAFVTGFSFSFASNIKKKLVNHRVEPN